MARRISRKGLRQDEFIEAALDTGEWVEKHWRPVAAIGGAAVALLLIVLAWNGWSGRRDAEVSRLLSEGLSLYAGDRGVAGAPPKAAAATGRPAEALPLFQQAARAGKNTPRGQVAAFYQGVSLLRLGRASEAAPVLEEVADKASDRPLADAARGMLAEAYEKAGDVEKAAATYRKLAETPGAAFPPDVALMQLARLLEERGRTDEARQVLKDIVTKYGGQGAGATAAREKLEGKKPGS